jgi:hypothetical protein
MRAFAITWDGLYRNLMVATCPTLEDAKAVVENARADGGIAAAADVDLDKSGPALVGLYNALGALATFGEGNDAFIPISRFATRADGQRRVFALLEANFKNAPEAAAPPKAEGESAATTETATEEKEAEVAKKGKTKKAAKAKVPAAKKDPKPKKAKGAKATVRENSSYGRALKYGVDGSKTLAQVTALVKLKDNGRNPLSRVKFRLKKVAALVGGTFEIDEKTSVVEIKLPKGVTLDSIFGNA